MVSNSEDDYGTDDLSNPPSICIQVYRYFESTGKSKISPKEIHKKFRTELQLDYNYVYKQLTRLKKKHLLINDKTGLWRFTSRYLDNVSSLRYVSDCGTEKTCGYSELYHEKSGSGFNPAGSRELYDLSTLILTYDSVHGIECHLPSVSSSTIIGSLDANGKLIPEKIGSEYYSLENRKLRVGSTEAPIKFDELLRVQGIVEGLLHNIGYDGKVWLTHLELNLDLQGYILDGIQRIEFRAISGTIYRLYQKGTTGKPFVRSEAIKSVKSKVIQLGPAIYVINLMKNWDDIHHLNQEIAKENGTFLQEMHRSKIAITNAGDNIVETVDSKFEATQNQLYDLNYKMDGFTDEFDYRMSRVETETSNSLDVQKQILQQSKIHTSQNTIANQRLAEMIQQGDLYADNQSEMIEYLRRIDARKIDFKQLKFEIQYQIMKELRKQRWNLTQIADLLKYSHRSGVSNWITRNAKDLRNVDNDTSVNIDILNDQDTEIDNLQLNKVDSTLVYMSISYKEKLRREYQIDDLNISVLDTVKAILKKLKTATSQKIISEIKHKPEAQVRDKLSKLVHKYALAMKDGDDYVWAGGD